MPTALVIGARNLGFAVIERLLADGWTVTGAAQSEDTLARVRDAGADALAVDVTDQASVAAALASVAERHGRIDLLVNAASPYRWDGTGTFGGGALAEAPADGFDTWTRPAVEGAFAFLSAGARFLTEQGGPATVVQVTGGSAKRGMPGRGPWAAGAFAVRALTQSAAQELRGESIQVALLVVDARIDQAGDGGIDTADLRSLGDAVAYLAGQSPRAMTHELQVTPAGDGWTP
jgi:NAD(P)-dependent dehydrogenase (short-subunit alcohol dehydrogenase family)